MKCRHCACQLEHVFLDLGFAPPSNAYLDAADLNKAELYLPLKLYVCTQCWLVQTEDYSTPEDLFTKNYAYFSSVSTTWLNHAQRYSDMIRHRLDLGSDSFVVEVAANDGYLLKNFVAASIPCLGIEPTASTAALAESLGIPIVREFFGADLAQRLAPADLIIGNNVYAHVPDINDFTAGLRIALKRTGTVTLEFPHLMRLIEGVQFDTVYHEHFSYLSLLTVSRIFSQAGLRIWDVEEIPTHGGSLRVYGCHAEADRITLPSFNEILKKEKDFGLHDLAVYHDFQDRISSIKNEFNLFLINQKKNNKTVAAFGGAAKGSTLLNFAGIKPDLLPYVCDSAPSKQGKFLPGTHIPILPPSALKTYRPDFVVILPWNISDEIIAEHRYVRDWGGQFVIAIPQLTVL